MDITLWIEIILFITLMPFSGFFSSSETSLFSRSKMQLEQMRCDDALNQTLIKHLPSQSRRLIVTILMIMNSSKSPHPWSVSCGDLSSQTSVGS